MSYPTFNEQRRLRELHRLEILDTPPEPAFDRIVESAKQLFNVPFAVITFLDAERQWFKAGSNENLAETRRKNAFCNYTIMHDSVFVVPDATKNSSLSRNPYVAGEPNLRFYAGAPLTIMPDVRIGTVCILDIKPRDFSKQAARQLSALASMVVSELWLRESLRNTASPETTVIPVGNLNLPRVDRLSGRQLRAARGLLNWSVAELSRRCGLSSNTISRLETGRSTPGVSMTSNDLLRQTFENAGLYFIGNRGAAMTPPIGSSQNW